MIILKNLSVRSMYLLYSCFRPIGINVHKVAFTRIQMFPYGKMYDHFVRANQSGRMYSGIPLKHELKVEPQNKYVTDLSSEETIGLMSSSPRTSSISW